MCEHLSFLIDYTSHGLTCAGGETADALLLEHSAYSNRAWP